MAASDIYLSGVTPATSGRTARGAAGSPTASASTTTAAWPSGERKKLLFTEALHPFITMVSQVRARPRLLPAKLRHAPLPAPRTGEDTRYTRHYTTRGSTRVTIRYYTWHVAGDGRVHELPLPGRHHVPARLPRAGGGPGRRGGLGLQVSQVCNPAPSLTVSSLVLCSAPSVSLSVFTIMENAPSRAFSWLKAPTSTITFKTLC